MTSNTPSTSRKTLTIPLMFKQLKEIKESYERIKSKTDLFERGRIEVKIFKFLTLKKLYYFKNDDTGRENETIEEETVSDDGDQRKDPDKEYEEEL